MAEDNLVELVFSFYFFMWIRGIELGFPGLTQQVPLSVKLLTSQMHKFSSEVSLRTINLPIFSIQPWECKLALLLFLIWIL